MSEFRQYPFHQLARAYPALHARAVLKQAPEDFVVVEELPFELSGEGEHAWLQIRKRNCNTDWVAARLAAFAGVKKSAVGFAGLKDRYALTTQWFSVYLPGRDDVDWQELDIPDVDMLQCRRHQRKLQRGALKRNRFTLRLRAVEFGSSGPHGFEQILERCDRIRRQGVPNYFGEQRFGRDMSNLSGAQQLFAEPRKRLSRHKRSLYLSAARSWLFNAVLSERVAAGNWNRRIDGDVFMLDGRSACFRDDASRELDQRLRDGEIHPSAVLWGDGESMATGDCAVIETAVIDRYPIFRQGLIDARVGRQRRALRVQVNDLQCRQEGADLMVAFSLPAGSYATMVLREVIELEKNEPIRGRME